MKSPIRLLPSVIALGTGLLVLNATSLVHGAEAQSTAGTEAALTASAAPANADYAQADDQVASAAQVDVLGSFAKRRNELDAREAQMKTQDAMLTAAEARVDGKIAQLKSLQDQITKLLTQRDAAQDAQVTALVKTYSAMKPADAARIFNSLQDDVLVPVAQQMKSDVLALVLSKMNPDAAQKLTVKLANRLVLPVDATGALTSAAMANPAQPVAAPGAPAPQAAAAPAAPGPQASAAPAAPAKKPAGG